MSRIIKEKGIDIIFRYCDSLKKSSRLKTISIDFYGPIGKSDEVYFYDNIKKYSNLNYHGVLDEQEIHKVLNKYDILLLPTRYPGEGFPGAVLDAYIAGIPVLVSNWKDIPCFVDEGETGFVFDLKDELEFSRKLLYLNENKEVLVGMKNNALNKSYEYSSDKCMEILLHFLN